MALSDLERRLLERWNNTAFDSPQLRKVRITGRPALRGIRELEIRFDYPVVAVTGPNGSGKSTVMSCCACAYHNITSFVPAGCKSDHPYYTFGQFFQFTSLDQQIRDVRVTWEYKGKEMPDSFEAVRNTKWSKYERRPNRSVQFVGLSRALPPHERNVLRSHFGGVKQLRGTTLNKDDTKYVNKVLGTQYDKIAIAKSRDYSLPVTSRGGTHWISGFNLGAGEDSFLEMYQLAAQCPKGTLLIIEELETALHPKAQSELVKLLLQLSFDRHLQVILTTHSPVVLNAIPPAGRVYLKRSGEHIEPLYKVSAEFALSMMSTAPSSELCIYLEDNVSKAIVSEILPAETRKRCSFHSIGSWTAIVTQLSAHLRNSALGRFVAAFDGDCNETSVMSQLSSTYQAPIDQQIKARVQSAITFLPGGVSPEKWIQLLFAEDTDFGALFVEKLKITPDIYSDLQGIANTSDSHDLIREIGLQLGYDESIMLNHLAHIIAECKSDQFRSVKETIQRQLNV